jgi:hypothetical protein
MSQFPTITQTFENLRLFIRDLVKVLPYAGHGYDLRLDVKPYPESSNPASSSVLASAGATDSSNPPREGRVQVNTYKRPSSAQNFDSPDRSYFMTLLHELTHVLAFSSGLFNRWDTITNGTGKQIHVTDSRYGITHQFLATPALTAFIARRFRTFPPPGSVLGLELEDSGSPGTAGSHPHERLFLSDLMQGVIHGPSYLSAIFEASLRDSGWYDVNASMIEGLAYLDAELWTVGERLTAGAILEPPPIGFPPSAFCKKANQLVCFHDSVTRAICQVIGQDEMNVTADNPNMRHWFNPFGEDEVGVDQYLDYAFVPLPGVGSCRDSGTVRRYDPKFDPDGKAEAFGIDSVCAMSRLGTGAFASANGPACYRAICRTDNRLELVVKNKAKLCVDSDSVLSFDGVKGKVSCPPARAACLNMQKRTEINMFTIVPDEGPKGGGNLVRIFGSDFEQYPDLAFLIAGKVPCNILERTDGQILCQVGKNDDDALVGQRVSLTGSSAARNMVTTIPEMYIFTEFS